MEKELATLEDLALEAEAFSKRIQPRAGRATLVTLSGELGAGKTTFTQGVARAFGVVDAVTSPTFVLEKIYALTTGAFKRLVHIDAYRLKSGLELTALGFDEVMQDAGTLVLLEWPERVADTLPKPSVSITLKVLSSGGRSISYGSA